MKVIIAGSRGIYDWDTFYAALAAPGFDITEVVWGKHDQGVDKMVTDWLDFRWELNRTPFPAKWKQYGKAAGPIRNEQMADYGEALIAIWDGRSSGTANMIAHAAARGLPMYVHKTRRVHPITKAEAEGEGEGEGGNAHG